LKTLLLNSLKQFVFKQELEEIEEKWKQETLKLIGMVNKLKDENKRLSDSLSQNNYISNSQSDQLGMYSFFDFFNLKFLL